MIEEEKENKGKKYKYTRIFRAKYLETASASKNTNITDGQPLFLRELFCVQFQRETVNLLVVMYLKFFFF